MVGENYGAANASAFYISVCDIAEAAFVKLFKRNSPKFPFY